MSMKGLDRGLTPATLPPINQVSVVYFWVALLLHILLTKSVGGDERGDISGDDGGQGFSSQDTSQYSFHYRGESVGVGVIGGNISHTRHSFSHNPGCRGRLLGLSVAFFPVR